MLFDPFEEQFNPPPTFIQLGNRGGCQFGAVGAVQSDGLIADDAGAVVDRSGVNPLTLGIGLGPQHKITAGLIHQIQPREIQIRTVHKLERIALGKQSVQDVDIMQLAVGNMDECRNIAAQIQQCV